MMKYIIFLIYYTILTNIDCLSQDSSTIKIKIVEYNVVFYPGNCDSNYFFKINNDRYLEIKLFNCKGAMEVRCINKSKNVLEKGSYIGSLDTLKVYRTSINATTQKTKVIVMSYYQPLRDGKWYFYYPNGKLKYIKYYSMGVLE